MTSTSAPAWKALRATDLSAEALLLAMNVKAAPVDVEEIAKSLGVRIREADRSDNLAGCLWFKGDKAELSLDKSGVVARKRFTVAMLLCHLLRHPEGTYNRNQRPQSSAEEEAAEFASALLMPDRFLKPLLENNGHLDPARLARKFKVSMTAMEFRLESYDGAFGQERHEAEPEAQRATDASSARRPKDPWALFGVKPGAPLAEVRIAYHRELAQYHPDKYEHLAPEMKALASQRTREFIAAFESIEAATTNQTEPAPSSGDTAEDHSNDLPPKLREIAELLKNAKWWISNRGWCQGSNWTDGYGKKVSAKDSERAGKFSIVGAVWKAAGEKVELRAGALQLISLVVKERPWHLQAWNDRPERTRAHVLFAIEQAIQMAEQAAPPFGSSLGE